MGDKLHGQKGNSPDPPLRSLNPAKCKRKWAHVDNQDVGLEAATIERVRNSLLVEWRSAPIMYGGSSLLPKLRRESNLTGRGALRVRRSGLRKQTWSARK